MATSMEPQRGTEGSRVSPHRSAGPREAPSDPFLCPGAERLRDASARFLGPDRAIEIVGHSQKLCDVLRKLEKVAGYEEPVLIHGESGVGKESLAQAVHLLSPRRTRPFVSVNCPQYQEGNLTVSELFGHRKGSFTGAVADRKGCFETADGGVIFLDEIGDLNMNAQVMLLRAIANGEFQPLGSETVRTANVRIVSATNRSLNQLVLEQHFRNDLLFRLRYFLIEPPPLRDRGDDWRMLIEFSLAKLHLRYGIEKRFTADAISLLEGYPWPGNVRELLGIVTTGYALSDGDQIRPRDFADRLEQDLPTHESGVDQLYRRLQSESGDFWHLVHEPFIDRDLSRREVRRLIARGLRDAHGNYRRLLELWRVPAENYQKFMDFLRHHRLKPQAFRDEEP
jgi:transcriptional regulator with GAF, ATPase, and Fis domain